MNPPQYSRTFVDTFEQLETNRQEAVVRAIEMCLPCLGRRSPLPGLGLKRLKKHYWQMRSSLADRIIFEWHGNDVTFRFVGSHDDIRRFIQRHA